MQVAFHVTRGRGFLTHLYRQEPEPAYTFVSLGSEISLQERFAPGGLITNDETAWNGFEIVASFDYSPAAPRSRDPWQMREEFLQLENDNQELAAFLTKWGDWEGGFLHEVSKPYRLAPIQVKDSTIETPSYVLPESV